MDSTISTWSKTNQASNELHVGLPIPRYVAKQIHDWARKQPWAPGTELEHPTNHHITLLYAPEGHEHKDAGWIKHLDHAQVRLNGLHAFPADEMGHAYVLGVDSPEIEEHANELQQRAKWMGLPVPEYEGGFKPHITLGYGPDPRPPQTEVPNWEFDVGPSEVSPPRPAVVDGDQVFNRTGFNYAPAGSLPEDPQYMYHLAPTEDRERIRAHGIQMSDPIVRSPWLTEHSESHGVHVVNGNPDLAHDIDFLGQVLYDPHGERRDQHDWVWPHDIWRFPTDTLDESRYLPDPAMHGNALVAQDDIPPEALELHVPWEAQLPTLLQRDIDQGYANSYPKEWAWGRKPSTSDTTAKVANARISAFVPLYHWMDRSALHKWMDPSHTGPGETWLTETGDDPNDAWNPDIPQMEHPVRLTIDPAHLDHDKFDPHWSGWQNNHLYKGIIPPEAITEIKSFKAPEDWYNTMPSPVNAPDDHWPEYGEVPPDEKQHRNLVTDPDFAYDRTGAMIGKTADYYHIAPTEDRARIHQHGLQPSLPRLNPRWHGPDQETIWGQQHGIYLFEGMPWRDDNVSPSEIRGRYGSTRASPAAN